ncbi:MAG: hypothetical protein J6W18_09440 [Bacteroidaceae bacterium]|nr:hypothetical protein [Bacteroidaceae bacterium]
MKGLLKVTVILSAIILSGCGNETDIDEDVIADVEPTGRATLTAGMSVTASRYSSLTRSKELAAPLQATSG